MKITKVETFLKEYTRNHMAFKIVGLRIYTDAGVYGDGEVAGIHSTWCSFGMLRDMAPRLIGRDPFDTDALWDEYNLRSFWGQNAGAFWYAGVSAIDLALWDIKSKALNVPLHKLLGGKKRDKVRCYASQIQFGWGANEPDAFTVEGFAHNARLAIEDGYDAVKVDLLSRDEDGRFMTELDRFGLLPHKYVDLYTRRLAAVREAVGPDVDIIIENHCGTDTQSARQLAKASEPYNIFFFEEPQSPVPYNNRTLSKKIDLPIAHGERIFGRWDYMPFFNDGSVAVIQPDLGNGGGITEVKKVCDLAHVFDVGVQIHTCGTHLLTGPSVILEACIPNFIIHEQHTNTFYPELRCMTKKHFDPVNGYLPVPEEPGIGNEWTDEALNTPNKFVFE